MNEKLQNELLHHYSLPAAIASIAPVKGGLINHTWKIILENDTEYILQQINTNIFLQPYHIAANLQFIGKYLADKYPDYLFVAPLETIDGEGIVRTEENGFFRLFPFVAGSQSIDVITNAVQAFEGARQFGKFTYLLKSFDTASLQPALPDFHNLELRYLQFQLALKHGNAERIQEAKDVIDFLISQDNILDTFMAIQKNDSFSKRVTHHDTKISNVLFNANGKGLCVIDLDTVMPGYFISDVGDMMRTYLSPVNEEESDLSKIGINEEYFAEIVKGYGSEMKAELSAQEKRHFVYAGKFMVYMQALRFLTDHLNNDIYYGATYEGHNLIRAKNQACLLERIIEKESSLEKIAERYL